MITHRYTRKPFLGLVLKEIQFTKEVKHLLIYSEKHNDLKLLNAELVEEMERPEGLKAGLFFYEKRREKIVRSFIQTYGRVNVDEEPINHLEQDVQFLKNKLLS